MRNQWEIRGAKGAEEKFYFGILETRLLLCGVRRCGGGENCHLVIITPPPPLVVGGGQQCSWGWRPGLLLYGPRVVGGGTVVPGGGVDMEGVG